MYKSIFGDLDGKDWADIVDENVEADIQRIKQQREQQEQLEQLKLKASSSVSSSAASAAVELDLLAESSRDGINLLFKKTVGVNDNQGSKGAISFGGNYFGVAFPKATTATSSSSSTTSSTKTTGNVSIFLSIYLLLRDQLLTVFFFFLSFPPLSLLLKVWVARKQQQTATLQQAVTLPPTEDNTQRRIGKRSSSALYADSSSSGALIPVLEEEEEEETTLDSVMSSSIVTPDKETTVTESPVASFASLSSNQATITAPQAPSKTVSKNLSFAGALKGLKPTDSFETASSSASSPSSSSSSSSSSSLAPISINRSASGGSAGNGGIEKKRRVDNETSVLGGKTPSSPSPSPIVSIIDGEKVTPVAVFSSFESFSEAFFKQGAAIAAGSVSTLPTLSVAQIEAGISVKIGSASLSISLPTPSSLVSDMDGDSITPASAMDASMMTTATISGEFEELTEARIAARQRDIDFGKALPGYTNYLATIPIEKRIPRCQAHPQTPDKYELMGKRRWQGLVKAWKRGLHQWDAVQPPESLSTVPAAASSPVDSLLKITISEGDRTVTKE
jgi:hypothetical protein